MDYKNCKTTARYCDFVVDLSTENFQLEHCKFCHREVGYKKIQGRVDNTKYLMDHIRDFCQSTGSTRPVYEFVYGLDGLKKRKAEAKKIEGHRKNRDDLGEGAKEYVKSWNKTSFSVKGLKNV